jgi:two-component system, OmpR family, response regulator
MAKNSKKVRIYSALEVANICGVVNQTAINWIKIGYLKAFTTPGGQYRVYSEDLVGFLRGRGMKIPDELKEFAGDMVTSMKVLIVDDDRALNNLLKQYLEKHFPGFLFLQAFDGFEAGSVIATEKPGLILLDIDLPGINGHEICRKLKGDNSLGKPKIIVISGLSDPSLKDIVLEEGADMFLEKPLDFEDVMNALGELLKLPAAK